MHNTDNKRIKELNEFTIVNKEGEIVDNSIYNDELISIVEPVIKRNAYEDAKESLKGFKSEKQRQGFLYKQNKTEFQNLINKECGDFIFNKYNDLINKLRDNEGNVDSALLFKVVYLASYINYDGVLMFGAMSKGSYRDYMTIKDFQEVLQLGKKGATTFKKQLLDHNLITVEDDKIYMNKEYFCKGKVSKSYVKDSSRCFVDFIQELYKGSTIREHRKLGLFIQLLPYVQFEHNVLVANPEEQNPENLIPLTLQDMCKLFGVTRTHARRLENDLFEVCSNGNYFLGQFRYLKMQQCYVINPKAFYKGNNIESLKGIIYLFSMTSK